MTKDIGKVGTLTELGLKVGDGVECVRSVYNNFIAGKIYKANDVGLIVDEVGNQCGTSLSTFRVISRASEEPKTWGQMTDEEKGTLLLAKHEGKVIEWFDTKGASDNWMECPAFGNHMSKMILGFAYRVKPEPVVETVSINVGVFQGDCLDFGRNGTEGNTHRITFEVKDGEPDVATIAMEKL